MRAICALWAVTFSISGFSQISSTDDGAGGQVINLDTAVRQGVYSGQFRQPTVTGYYARSGDPLSQTFDLTSEEILKLYQGGLSKNGAPLELNNVYFEPKDLSLAHVPISDQLTFQYQAFSNGVDVALENIMPATVSPICGEDLNPAYTNLNFDAQGKLLPITLNDLCSHPVPTNEDENNPEACGYRQTFPNLKAVADFCQVGNALVEHGPKQLPEDMNECHISNCTTASFLGMINLLRTRTDIFPHIRQDLKCNLNEAGAFRGFGPIYSIYKEGNGLRNVVEYLNTQLTDAEGKAIDFGATYHNINMPQGEIWSKAVAPLAEKAEQGIPAAGDPIQIERPGSGHAAIFSNYRRNEKGLITHICYWTSNQSGSGTGIVRSPASEIPRQGDGGNRCERLFRADGTSRITSLGSASGIGGAVQVLPATTLANNGN